MECHRARRVLFLWVDRDREQLPVEHLWHHFEECPECRQHAERVERVVMLLRTRCRCAPPEDLASRIRGLLDLDPE
jgi:predicted anti-sigma-YlaC factor YlaD